MTLRGKVVRNTLVSGLARVVVAAIGFILLPYMIKKLGMQEFGLIGICNLFSIGGYVSLLDFGLQASITKYVAEYRSRGEAQKLSQLINSALCIFSCVGLAAMLAGLGATSFLATSMLAIPGPYVDSFEMALTVIFLSYLFGFPNMVFVGVLEGLQRFDILKGTHIALSLLTACAIFAVLYSGYGYISVIVVTLGFSFVGFLFHVLICIRLLPSLGFRRDFVSAGILKEVGRMSRLIFAGRVFGLIHLKAERLLIGMFLGPVFMASYEVLIKLPEFIKSLLGVGHAAVMPAASELHAADRKGSLRKLLMEGCRFNLCFYFPLITGAVFFARPFLEIWLGKEFGELAGLTQAYLAQYLLFILVVFGFTLLQGMNTRLKDMTLITFVGTGIKIVVMLGMIREFDLWAIVIGSLVSMILPLPFSIRIILQEFDLTLAAFLREVWSALSLVVVPLVVSYIWEQLVPPQNLGVLAIEGLMWCISYWAALYAFALSGENRLLIKNLLTIKFLSASPVSKGA